LSGDQKGDGVHYQPVWADTWRAYCPQRKTVGKGVYAANHGLPKLTLN